MPACKKYRPSRASFLGTKLRAPNVRFIALCCGLALVNVLLYALPSTFDSLLDVESIHFKRGRDVDSQYGLKTSSVPFVTNGDSLRHDPSRWHVAACKSNTSSENARMLHRCYSTRNAQLFQDEDALPIIRRCELEARMKPLQRCLASTHLDIFWAMWLSSLASWGPRQNLFLSSLFVNHPDACLILILIESCDVRSSFNFGSFEAIKKLGYCLLIVYVDGEDLWRSRWWLSAANKKWLQTVTRVRRRGFIAKWTAATSIAAAAKRHPFWVSHITDYLRFYLLHKYGGTYVDTDAIFLQGLPPAMSEFYGLDVSPTVAQPWFVNVTSRVYVAPGVMRARPSSPVMRYALEMAFDLEHYNSSCFNCVGPRALSMAILRRFGGEHIITPGDLEPDILPPRCFYPLHYDRTHLLFGTGKPMISLFLQHAQRHAYALHLYGHASANLTIQPGSGMAQLISLQTLTADSGIPQLLSGKSRRKVEDRPYSYETIAKGDAALSIISPRIIVVKGTQTQLMGPHAVYVRTGQLNDTVLEQLLSVTVFAKYGRIQARDGNADPHRATFNGAQSIQQVNAFLSECIYHVSANEASATDTLKIEISVPINRRWGRAFVGSPPPPKLIVRVPVAVFNRLVTVVTHTRGRVDRVTELHASVQQWFPGTRVLASEDTNAVLPIDGRQRNTSRTLRWTRLPLDSGLSVARNTLVHLATTPFVQFLDDDFILDSTSHLDLLLERLELHPHVGIASPVIPADMAQGCVFQGLMQARGGALRLERGHKGYLDGCARVDYVPNVFMARRDVIIGLDGGWDPVLKLGEHEEFFWRLKQRVHVDVLSCKFVAVQHRQFRWWAATPDDRRSAGEYILARSRIYNFYAIALAKHNFTSLVIDGQSVGRGFVV